MEEHFRRLESQLDDLGRKVDARTEAEGQLGNRVTALETDRTLRRLMWSNVATWLLVIADLGTRWIHLGG